MADDDQPSVLVLVVDVNPLAWGQPLSPEAKANGASASAVSDPLTFAAAMDQLMVYINAYLLLHRRNRICVIAATPYFRSVSGEGLDLCFGDD
jgi:hypothetical protein